MIKISFSNEILMLKLYLKIIFNYLIICIKFFYLTYEIIKGEFKNY